MQDALYEYELLLQKYPDDLQLRKEAEQCRSQVLFTQLVHDGDELFYQYHNYPAALEKYRKAIQIRPDDTIQHKIRKCAEVMQSQRGETIHSMPSPPSLNPVHKTEATRPTQMLAPKNEINTAGKTPIIVAIIWLALCYGTAFIDFYEWYLPITPVLIVTGVVFAFRYKSMSVTEMLLYAFACLPSIILWGIFRWRTGLLLILSLMVILTFTIIFYRMVKKRIQSFNPIHLVMACLAMVVLSAMVGGRIFMLVPLVFGVYSDMAEYRLIGVVAGTVAGLCLSIYFWIKWTNYKMPDVRLH